MAEQISPRMAIMQLIDLMKLISEEAAVIAEGKRRLYEAYINQGLTPEEAMSLIKPHPGSLF